MNDPIELEVTPVNAEIIITMPAVQSVNLELLPVLIPEETDIDFLAQYLLARG